MSVVRKPRIFIGCVTEKKDDAVALQTALTWGDAEVWDQGMFGPSATFIESLERELPTFDLAVFILTPDDITESRGKMENTPRDNLILEVGLSIGFFGRSQTFIICPEGQRLKLPTDLSGVTTLDYNPNHKNLISSFAPSSRKIRQKVEENKSDLGGNLPKMLRQIVPSYQNEFRIILDRFCDDSFKKYVLRKNWTVNLEFDLTHLQSGEVAEEMESEYSVVNISNSTIEYPIKVMSMEDGEWNQLISVSKDVGGRRETIALKGTGIVPGSSDITTYSEVIELEPSIVHHIKLRYVNKHHTDPSRCWIHNSLSAFNHTLEANISAKVPEGYMMNMFSTNRIEPDKWGNKWGFRIPSPLLAHQIIEYMFYKA